MNGDFSARINGFVRTMTKGYQPTGWGEKIIHDPIWGSVVFRPWEVRLIDSPLFQRLRGISQVGLAETTYPAARHTRFEHSLGTAAIASRMMERLCADARQRGIGTDVIGEKEVCLLRLAALLHDVGHCPYSHLSEAVYSRMPEFIAARERVIAQSGQAISPSPHEVFSYYVITSDQFASFFHKHIGYPYATTEQEVRDLLQRAANLVVGAVNYNEKGERCSFLTRVLNGNFDADKLDYTQRDSYTAGIALTYGVERFLLKLVLCKTETDGITDYRLALTSDALSTVEELIFNRSMLYHYMYRHQKVLAAESQMRDAIFALVAVGKIKHPCDFLYLTNRQLEGLYDSRKRPFEAYGAKRNKTLKALSEAFSHRALMKRAAEFTPDRFEEYALNDALTERTLAALQTADGEEKKRILTAFADNRQREILFPKGIEEYIRFLKGCSTEEYIAERREIVRRIALVYEEAGKTPNFDAFDLAVSFLPPLESDLSLTIVDKHRAPMDGDPAIERIRRWTDTLNLSKWRGYLFVSPRVDRALAGKAFEEYLKERCKQAENL